MTCRLLPPQTARSKVALEKLFVESGIGGGSRLPQSQAPTPQVTVEVPLTRSEVGENLRVGIRAGDILISLERPTGLSARNLSPPKSRPCAAKGPQRLSTPFRRGPNIPVKVHLTPRAVESLQLKVGDMIWLVLKTHSCHVMRGLKTRCVLAENSCDPVTDRIMVETYLSK